MSKLIVYLDNIKQNCLEYKNELKDDQKLCAVVKANAYGFGAKQICQTLNGVVDYFAVSCESEFFEIKNIVNKPILILDPIYKNITKLAKNSAEICLSNFVQLNQIIKAAKRNLKTKYRVHIAINTGMNRFGFNSKNQVLEVIEKLEKTQNVIICGVFSHFFYGNNSKSVKNQVQKFNLIKRECFKNYNVKNVIFHIANTDGFEFCNDFDMARIGIGLYTDRARQTVKLLSNIVEIQHLKRGDIAGYSGVFKASRNSTIAVVSIGYGDGIPKSIENKGYVLVNNCFAKIVACCMDSILIDVTNIKCKINDEVVLIGSQGANHIFICDFGLWCGTIEYEVIIRLSSRIKRTYIGENYAGNYRKVQSEKTRSS